MKDYKWFLKKYVKPFTFRIIFIIIMGVIVAASNAAVIGFVKLVQEDIFTDKNRDILRMSAMLHDVGKMAISDRLMGR